VKLQLEMSRQTLLEDIKDIDKMNHHIHTLALTEETFDTKLFRLHYCLDDHQWLSVQGNFSYVFGVYATLRNLEDSCDETSIDLDGHLFYEIDENHVECTLLREVLIPASKRHTLGYLYSDCDLVIGNLSFLSVATQTYPTLQVKFD